MVKIEPEYCINTIHNNICTSAEYLIVKHKQNTIQKLKPKALFQGSVYSTFKFTVQLSPISKLGRTFYIIGLL